MNPKSKLTAFTLIELLTVIAIIAVLAAILFPIAGTVREQARATNCMSKMHQLWVACNVYRQDEGGYPDALLGFVEIAQGAPGNCNPDLSTGLFLTDPINQCVADAGRVISGFMYREQVKDINIYNCPDNIAPIPKKTDVTIAHFPLKPANWPAGYNYVTDPADPALYPNAPSNVCGSDGFGLIDCYLTGPLRGMPKYYYMWDSYDIGPRMQANGLAVKVGNAFVYDKHYGVDWTGVTGANDLPAQLKYQNPPPDKTMLTLCTYHQAVSRSNGAHPAISLAGSAKKADAVLLLQYGADYFNK
jgi:prepilin-type N-terminal cleavage/methylation domain-containing protein